MCPVCLCPDWDIQLGIDHTRIGDLTVVLTHLATNTSVVLMDRPGFPALPQGCAEDLSSQSPILLTDQAVIPIECGPGCQQCFPNGLVQSASYLPNQPLAILAGNPRPGPWRLFIRDNAQGGTGRFAFMSFMVEAQGNNAVIEGAPTAEFQLRLTPNPTRDTVRFELTLSEASSTRLQVFDVAGRVVSTVYDGQLPSGHHSLIWAGVNEAGGLVPAGAYFYRLTAGDRRESGGFNVVR
jgi:subtilisin-like proprotein convertase family protein